MSEKTFGAGPAVPVSLPQFTPIARSRRFHVERTLGVGLTLLGIVALIAIAAPLLTQYDPLEQRFTEAFLPPFSPDHILGTDNFGRDPANTDVRKT